MALIEELGVRAAAAEMKFLGVLSMNLAPMRMDGSWMSRGWEEMALAQELDCSRYRLTRNRGP
jgi:hypothetical protein